MSAALAAIDRKRLDRRLARCGVIAGPLFIGTFLLGGMTRDGYRPARHPISSLALGPQGWVQMANFAITGSLYLAASIGLYRAAAPPTRTGPVLVGSAAVGMLGAAAFPTDPISGYPPGTPDILPAYTTLGALHDAFAMPTFIGLPVAALVFARAFLVTGTADGPPTPPAPNSGCWPPSHSPASGSASNPPSSTSPAPCSAEP